ncbi:MAG: hypothetical protein VX112_05090 [Pseudomonadota bacterium]|nr:hypothetical protein [Pseudomonadota bacterium]
MAKKDFDFKDILNTVRSTINPEYAIPAEKDKHPVNFRIMRVKKLIAELHKAQQLLSAELSKLDTHVGALIEEVQPYLDDEKKVTDEDVAKAEKEDSTEVSTEDSKDETKEDK